jgi:hypothetical protein
MVAARADLVGETERRWGTRGVRPRSLDKAWSWVRARVYPRGRQVGQGSHLGADTRLASGGGKREGLRDLGEIYGMHGSGLLLSLFLSNFSKC